MGAVFEGLKEFVKERESLELVQVPVDRLSDQLPPSFRQFTFRFGFIYITYNSSRCLEMFAPEVLCGAGMGENPGTEKDLEEALAFQRINDDNVDNFYCFNPRVDLGKGEWPVVFSYHDEAFSMDCEASKYSLGFSEHIVKVLAAFMKDYEQED